MTESKMGWISGWKTIAMYCDVTVKTVQKYADEMGLPIRKVGSKVFALPAELDKWLLRQDAE